MTRRRSEAGDSKIGCILWALVVAVGVLIGWKMIPVKIATAELEDFMVEQAKWASGYPPEAIQKAIVQKAQELELPVDLKQVTVSKAGGRIRMRASYDVPLEFPGYTYDWHFDQDVDRPIYIW